MKLFSIHPSARALLPALAYLLAACGVAGTGSAPPVSSPIAVETPVAAPTQPAPPTAAPTSSAPPTAAAAPTSSAPPTAAAAPTAVSQASAANMLISYHKSGGIAGVNETITVYADGTIELRDKRGSSTAKADSSSIQALQKLLTSPEFASLQVPASPPGADQFVYELTVPGRAKPIVTADSANIPPVLGELVGMLEQMKTQYK